MAPVEAEVGAAVVEVDPEPGHGDAAAEPVVVGLDETDAEPRRIDSAEVGGVSSAAPGGAGDRSGPPGGDGGGPGGVGQPVGGEAHVGRIGEVGVALGQGGGDGLDQPVLAIRSVGRERAGPVEEVKGEQGGRSLAVGRERGDGQIPVPALQRHDPLTPVGGQVALVEEPVELLHVAGEGGADLAPIEGVGAAGGEAFERPGQVRLVQPDARPGPPVDRVPVAPGGVGRPAGPDAGGAGGREREPVPGVGDGGGGQGGEWPRAEPLEQGEPGVGRPGHRDGEGPVPGHRRLPGGPGGGSSEAVHHGLGRGGGRGAARAVVAVEGAVPDEGEAVAAGPAGVGGDDAEDEVGGDGGVHGVAALPQDGRPGVGGEVVRRRQGGGSEPVGLRGGGRRRGQPSSIRRSSAVRWPWRGCPTAASCTS